MSRVKKPKGPVERLSSAWVDEMIRLAKEQGLTQKDIADKAGVNVETVGRIFRRAVTVSRSGEDIAKAVGGPLPSEPVGNAVYDRWCRVGKQLARIAPTRLVSILLEIEEALPAYEAVEKAERKLQTKLKGKKEP